MRNGGPWAVSRGQGGATGGHQELETKFKCRPSKSRPLPTRLRGCWKPWGEDAEPSGGEGRPGGWWGNSRGSVAANHRNQPYRARAQWGRTEVAYKDRPAPRLGNRSQWVGPQGRCEDESTSADVSPLQIRSSSLHLCSSQWCLFVLLVKGDTVLVLVN